MFFVSSGEDGMIRYYNCYSISPYDVIGSSGVLNNAKCVLLYIL